MQLWAPTLWMTGALVRQLPPSTCSVHDAYPHHVYIEKDVGVDSQTSETSGHNEVFSNFDSFVSCAEGRYI